MLVKRELSNPKLAAQYHPGDQIHYKTGSPNEHGIAANSTATVLRTNAIKIVLTVEPATVKPSPIGPMR